LPLTDSERKENKTCENWIERFPVDFNDSKINKFQVIVVVFDEREGNSTNGYKVQRIQNHNSFL
jgi:hypothetical protein